MRIGSARIKNFRSLRELVIDFDEYTALVGPNGAGKSSILYAIDWFFRGGALTDDDFHRGSAAIEEPGDGDQCVSVSVTFVGLTAQDRLRLGGYGRGETATFKRTWAVGERRDKIVGNALQGPGFEAVRSGRLVSEFRPAYDRLRADFPELADLGARPTQDACIEELSRWEDDPSHKHLLVEQIDVDATHLFGINGTTVLSQCSRMVLVPAALDIAAQVGTSAKKTALHDLVGALMAAAGEQAHAAWRAKHSAALAELQAAVEESVTSSTKIQAERVNNRLASLVPGTEVHFTPSLPEWEPHTEVSVRTDVVVNGVANDVARQGHGVQRAVMMTMLQALVPDEAGARAAHTVADEDGEGDAEERLKAELDRLPCLIIAIEEPEIYQHPIRARNFARVLSELASDSRVQVIVATHSPYFVKPERFASLRRVSIHGVETRVRQTRVADVAAAVGKTEADVEKIVQKFLPTAFSEAFFSDRVVLVEGDTDKAVVEMVAAACGTPLDAAGISVVESGGKTCMRIPYEILTQLGISTHTIVDGDALRASAKYASDPEGEARASASNRAQTEGVVAWLPGALSAGAAFGGATLSTPDFTLWRDDIETELEDWPSFMEALDRSGGKIRQKAMAHYRAAATEARVQDVPTTVRDCVRSIVEVLQVDAAASDPA
ncbi:AAA family ATPase [Cellulomonas sp. Y8]|uniref:AAA family ATPase n=1 Tax=Cellulomonas sp. Y8 TaxID=2591145 RepID=UPI003D704360